MSRGIAHLGVPKKAGLTTAWSNNFYRGPRPGWKLESLLESEQFSPSAMYRAELLNGKFSGGPRPGWKLESLLESEQFSPAAMYRAELLHGEFSASGRKNRGGGTEGVWITFSKEN